MALLMENGVQRDEASKDSFLVLMGLDVLLEISDASSRGSIIANLEPRDTTSLHYCSTDILLHGHFCTLPYHNWCPNIILHTLHLFYRIPTSDKIVLLETLMMM